MKNLLLMAVVVLGGFLGSIEHGHAMAVIDSSNLAQNIVAAREAITQTQQQIQQLQTQLNQYKRMLQDAANPGNWNWGDIEDTLNQLKNTMGSLNVAAGTAGGINQYLDTFGSHDKYSGGSQYGTGSSALYAGDLAGANLQKESADDLLRLVQEQQEAMNKYGEELERLKSQSSSAEGQQEAIQAGNQMMSMQIQLLSQIHALLMAQNTMMAAQVETQINREAQQRMGTAIKMGETDFTRTETSRGGKSYRQF